MKRIIILLAALIAIMFVGCDNTTYGNKSENDNITIAKILFEPMMSGAPVGFEFDNIEEFQLYSHRDQSRLGTTRDFWIEGKQYKCVYLTTHRFPIINDYTLEYDYKDNGVTITVLIPENDPEYIFSFLIAESSETVMKNQKAEEAKRFAIEQISRVFGEDVSKYYCEARYTSLPESVYTVVVYDKEGLCPKYIGRCDVVEDGDGFRNTLLQVVPKKVFNEQQTTYTYEDVVSMTEKAIQSKSEKASIQEIVMIRFVYSFESKCWAMQYNARIEVPDEIGIPQEFWVGCYLLLDK